MNELFKSKKIWPPNIIFPKKRAVKKFGILGIVFLFGVSAFISGYNINSYAASSNAVLPIIRGGTNANTASEAAANILGGNFDNYEGVLPVEKGGTAGTDYITAQNNLNLMPSFSYTDRQPNTWYYRIGQVRASASENWTNSSFTVVISANASVWMQQSTYLLTARGMSDSQDEPFVELINQIGPCLNRNIIFMTKKEIDNYTLFTFYVVRFPHPPTTDIVYLANSAGIQGNPIIKDQFTTTSNFVKSYTPKCISFVEPTPTPTPTDAP
ncbi:MAG: hypothetical protein LBT85_04160 [Bifidobacteriaceae bacterium]|nr:hypothetical protein [Bifidobacteriaceae bacterium]